MLYDVLLEHSKKYPLMEISDYIKLIYQNEFGCGHIITDAAAALQRLTEEFSHIKQNLNQPLAEDIGGGMCRINLEALDPDNAKALCRLMCLTADTVCGSVKSFEAKLNILKEMSKHKLIAIGREELDSYLVGYKQQGYPHLSHSDTYRNAYSPSYRVIAGDLAKYLPLLLSVERLASGKERQIIVIDGMCGAGKSSLAQLLQRLYGCNVFRTDDFFLPPALRTKERLSETGGNVDYIRFKDEILMPLQQGEAFSYSRFCCGDNSLQSVRVEEITKLNCIEGSYSLHPYFGDYADLKVFLQTDAQTQLRRIAERSGEEMLCKFLDLWIPMENNYFNSFNIREKANIIIDT